MARFIAHVCLSPNDGGDQYTVETEFKAGSYPQAWEHISKMALRFDGKITSHRIMMLGEEGSDDERPAIVTQTPAVARAEATLPGNVTPEVPALSFYGSVTVAMPSPVPFPTEEKTDDPVAA